MFSNVGTADRAIRILIGLAMILLAFFGKVPAWVGWVGLDPSGDGVDPHVPALLGAWHWAGLTRRQTRMPPN